MRRGLAVTTLAFWIFCVQPAIVTSNVQSTFTISANQISFQMVAGKALPAAQALDIGGPLGSRVNWSASSTDESFQLDLKPPTGTTPSKLELGPAADWALGLKPGTYKTTVRISAQGSPLAAASVDLVLTVVATLPGPKFTYLAGPAGCTTPAGYLDAAQCNVPDEKPPGKFTPPKPGASYIDKNFGAPVKIAANDGCLHVYSTPSPVSANGKYLQLNCPEGMRLVYASTAKVAFRNIPGDPNLGNYWDAVDDETYYYVLKSQIVKYDLRTRASTVLVDYATDGHGFKSVNTGGTGDSSKDNLIGFFAPDKTNICVFDVAKIKTYCADYSTMPGLKPRFIDFVLVSKGVDRPTGKRYVLLMALPALAAFSLNTAAGKLDFEYRGAESPENLNGKGNLNGVCEAGESCLANPHSDVFEDDAGIQYLVTDYETSAPCARSVITLQLNKGARILDLAELGGGKRVVMPMFQCGTVWSDGHYGCAKSAPYCVISTNHGGERDPKNTEAPKRTPHISELIVMRGNGLEIRRLAQTRSVLFKGEDGDSYWSLTRAAISNDGSYVVADSNFGVPNDYHVLLIQTGFGKPRIAAGGVLNSADNGARFSPGSLVSVYGTSLAGCTMNESKAPLPADVCGTRIAFDTKAARLLYADPSQVNLIVPSSTVLNKDIPVIATRADSGDSAQQVIPASFVSRLTPAIFTYMLDDQIARAVIQNADHSLNGPTSPQNSARPLRLGETGILYANGLGDTTPAVAEGHAAVADRQARTVTPISLYINDVPQPVTFSGLASEAAGVYEVHFKVNPTTLVRPEGQNLVSIGAAGVQSLRAVISLTNSSSKQ